MISEPSSTLASDYQQPALLMKHGSTTAFDPDRDLSQSGFSFILSHPGVATYDPRFLGDTVNTFPSTLFPDDFTCSTSPASLFMAEIAGKVRQVQEMCRAYWSRIESLYSDAVLDGFALNEASARDFWSFVGSAFLTQKAGLVLMDNGNLRAVWKGDNGSHLGLQFLGNQSVEYVIFKRRTAARDVSRVAGIDTLEGIKRQIYAFDLMALVYV